MAAMAGSLQSPYPTPVAIQQAAMFAAMMNASAAHSGHAPLSSATPLLPGQPLGGPGSHQNLLAGLSAYGAQPLPTPTSLAPPPTPGTTQLPNMKASQDLADKFVQICLIDA